jgi:hypothetical protein
MTEVDDKSFIEQMKKAIDDMNRKQAEYEHEQLIRLCEENDFIVPNEEVRKHLEEVLPEGTKIIVSKVINEHVILMVKKVALNPFTTMEITLGKGE